MWHGQVLAEDPGEWPRVLANFHRAPRPGGYLYFTTELMGESELRDAHEAGTRAGLPVIPGEHAHEGGYHHLLAYRA